MAMSLNEKLSERKFQLPALGENTLLAVVAVCFVVLHVLAIAILVSVTRSDAGTAPEPPRVLSGD
jgi:formate hydrogenlyase subunit 4